ncbi:MAG: 4Fe-4S binding protein [Dehalobacterium sp.]
MVFDNFAEYYVENGIARTITMDEALQIAKDGERDGRVILVYNSKDGEIMCSCCSCCCGLMILAKFMPGPASEFISNYYCQVDEFLCTGDCAEICVERCPVGARQIIDGKLQMDRNKCISCGLCVTICPKGALSLVRKPDDKIYDPPQTYFDTNKAMQKYRNI